MSKRPTVSGYEIYVDGKTHVAISASSAFKHMSKNDRLVFLNKMGQTLMQMIVKAQKEDM